MKGPRGVKTHPCPQCGRIRHFKTRSYYRVAVRTNSICKSCAFKKNADFHLKKVRTWWEKLSEEDRRKHSAKVSKIQKEVWAHKSEDQRRQHIERGKCFLRIAWLQLKDPSRRRRWKESLRKSFEKHREHKHWINRPETYIKIIESNKKYCGEGHWFKRSEVRKRWQAAMRKRYPGKKLNFRKTSAYI